MIRTLRAVRAVVTCCVLTLCLIAGASAQEQEKKLIDRLLKPDTSLQNSMQEKQFVARGSTISKQARTKSFHVPARPVEKNFAAGSFRTREFGTKTSRYQNAQARLTPRTKVAKVDVPYSTTSYRDVEPAREAGKAAEVPDFSGTRPFLIEGKSQKSLSRQDRPLTIDQVRELLNKNK